MDLFKSRITMKQAIALLSLSVGLGACASSFPPAYQYSRAVAEQFERATLLPDHTYYFFGMPSQPDAVIAIDNRFRMTSRVWSEVRIDQKQLDDWAFQFKTYQGDWSCP